MSRLNLQTELTKFPGIKNAYFNPPESIKMTYPCIRYSLAGADSAYANDKLYKSYPRYEITVIDTNPGSTIWQDVLNHFPMCSFDRSYPSNNLHHWVLTLYYL